MMIVISLGEFKAVAQLTSGILKKHEKRDQGNKLSWVFTLLGN